jgi:hypothetical protein
MKNFQVIWNPGKHLKYELEILRGVSKGCLSEFNTSQYQVLLIDSQIQIQLSFLKVLPRDNTLDIILLVLERLQKISLFLIN